MSVHGPTPLVSCGLPFLRVSVYLHRIPIQGWFVHRLQLYKWLKCPITLRSRRHPVLQLQTCHKSCETLGQSQAQLGACILQGRHLFWRSSRFRALLIWGHPACGAIVQRLKPVKLALEIKIVEDMQSPDWFIWGQGEHSELVGFII